MTSTASDLDLATLRASSQGPVIGPGEDGWDAAREAWNLTADQRPVAVAAVTNVRDVVAAVDFARENGLRVAAQATGHAATALEDLERTLLVKTLRMGDLEIDPVTRQARVGAGVLWGDLGVAAGEYGLAGLSGSSPDVGVVGYALGGGIGWLSRRHGLASNSITAIELVTAEGKLVRADHDHEPDLFWALRGGGGSFGVVTALEMSLVPLAQTYAGGVFWPAEVAAELMPAYRDWARDLPDEMTSAIRLLCLPPIPEVPEPLRATPVVNVTGAFDGDPAEGARLVDELRAVAPPMMDAFATMPAAGLCHINGDPEQPTPGMTHQTMIGELTDGAIEALLETAGPGSESPLLAVSLRHLGGAMAHAPEGAGALDSLDGEYAMYGVGVPFTPEMVTPIDAHLDRVVAAVEPWSTGRDYLNLAERPSDASSAFSADVYARLVEIRETVDPDSLFLASHPVR